MEGERGREGRPPLWINCDLPLEPAGDAVGGGHVVGLSLAAVRVVGVLAEAGAPIRLTFRLPGHGGPVTVRGRADGTLSGSPHLDVLIEGFEGDGEAAYRDFVASSVRSAALARQAEALRAPAGRLVPLLDRRRIDELFADSLAYRADALVHGSPLSEPVRATLVALSGTDLVFDLHDTGDRRPLAGARVRCALATRHGPYLFEASITAHRDGRLHVVRPDRVEQYEKRAEERTRVAGEPGAAVERDALDRIVIPLPAAYGGRLERPLIDVSEAGAAFRSLPGDPLFLPGTPLPGVEVRRGGRLEPARMAEVRQVSREPAEREEGSPAFRVGIAFDVVRSHAEQAGVVPGAQEESARTSRLARLSLVLRWSLRLARSRMPMRRRQPHEAGPLVNVVRYRTPQGEEIVSLVNSTRRLGEGGRLRGPLIVIPPAFGKTKETYCALALALTETFRRHRRDVLVVRYDDVRSVGESHKDPEDWPEERQMMRYSLSQGVTDLLATLDHFHGRSWFWPTQTAVISFSLAALSTRRAVLADRLERITHWFSVMGAADAQDVFFNATGGVDLIGGHRLGVEFGVMPVLGHLGDVDYFARDAIACGLATLRDARRDLARLRIPVVWFVGRDDRWVRPERIRDVMSVAAPGRRKVVELPIGHNLPFRVEALQSFEVSVEHLWTELYGEPPRDVWFEETAYQRVRALEADRLPRRRIGDPRAYWERYLLGDDGRGLGFDLWASTPAYRELLDLQRQLLDVSEGDVVADLGAGTGNFVEHLLERLARDGFRTSPSRVVVADLVPSALEHARRKIERGLDGVLLPTEFLDFRELNLETSRLRPIRRFVLGESTSVEQLRGLVDGLCDATIDAWSSTYDDDLLVWLRGAWPDAPVRPAVERLLGGGDLDAAVEFNRAARWIQGRLEAGDFAEGLDAVHIRALLEAPERIRAEHLRFVRLRLQGPGLADAFPFPEASIDKALLSLVVSYLFNPVETLREVHRVVRPGGRVVVSSVRPDADMSRLVSDLVDQVRTDTRLAARFGVSPRELGAALQKYVSEAAAIHDLAEGGVFRFFSQKELTDLLEAAGFAQVKVLETFGRPPLIWVAVGVKV